MTSLQEVYVSVKGIIADNLESMGVEASSSDGLTTLAGKILDIEPSVSGLDLDTALTLSASSSTVTVGNSITLTATLTASYDDDTLVNVDLNGVLQNATVKFYEGSTLKGTATTNSSGVATYTYTPTTGGNKTVKAVFDGTENFQDCESSSVSITVNKLSGSVTITPSSSSIVVGNNAVFSGVLNAGTGKQLSITVDNVVDGTVTTTTDGAWTYTVQNLAIGSYTIGVAFNGDDVYTNASNTASLTVIDDTPVPDSISLTSDKSILSYADSESATLSATVLDENNNPIEGETVEFFNSSTSMGTATTNSSGVATKTYASAGAGDVSFTAEVGSLVSETFGIEDIYDYDLTLYNDHQNHENTVSIPTGNFQITYVTKKNSSNRGGGVRWGASDVNLIDISCTGLAEYDGAWMNVNTSNSYVTANVEVTIKYTYIDGLHSYYVDDVLKTSFTKVKTVRGWTRIADNDTYIKDVKIKAL